MRKALCGLAVALCVAAAPAGAAPGGAASSEADSQAAGAKNTRSAVSGLDEEFHIPCTEFDLPNGLHVILHEDHTIPTVYTNIWYNVGSSNEQVGRTGFAHLFEHLMFEGSGHVKEGEFDRLLESVGGNNNASTSSDRTNYYCSAPSCALELPLFLESDRMGYLLDSMSPNVVDGQRDVVKNEMRQSYLNRPYAKLWLELPRMMYPNGHPYNWPVIGSMDDLTAAGYEDVVNFFKKYYVPNNASLVIAGDIDPKIARELVEKWFSEIKPGENIAPPKADPVELKGIVKKTIEDKVALPLRTQAWPTPAVYEPGDADLDILASILAGGKHSRLYKRLVYELQIAQSVSAGQDSSDLGSCFIIQYMPRPGVDIDKIQAIVTEEVKKIQDNPPSQEEIDRAVNRWESTYYYGSELIGERADMLNNYYRHFGQPDYFAKDLDRYHKVTPESVSDCAKRYLTLDKYVEITVVPEKKDVSAQKEAK